MKTPNGICSETSPMDELQRPLVRWIATHCKTKEEELSLLNAVTQLIYLRVTEDRARRRKAVSEFSLYPGVE